MLNVFSLKLDRVFKMYFDKQILILIQTLQLLFSFMG